MYLYISQKSLILWDLMPFSGGLRHRQKPIIPQQAQWLQGVSFPPQGFLEVLAARFHGRLNHAGQMELGDFMG
jgi:hypothetical protein